MDFWNALRDRLLVSGRNPKLLIDQLERTEIKLRYGLILPHCAGPECQNLVIPHLVKKYCTEACSNAAQRLVRKRDSKAEWRARAHAEHLKNLEHFAQRLMSGEITSRCLSAPCQNLMRQVMEPGKKPRKYCCLQCKQRAMDMRWAEKRKTRAAMNHSPTD